MKKSFILYQDQSEVFDALSDEQAGKLIKAIFDYTKGGKPILNSSLSIIFISFKQTLDRDLKKWDNICLRNRENIKKRWLKDTKDTSGISGIPNAVDSDSDNDITSSDEEASKEINKPKEFPLKSLLSYMKSKSGVNTPLVGKQAAALKKILTAGFTEEDCKWCIDKLWQDKFWQQKGFDLMTVADQLPKFKMAQAKGGIHDWRDEIKKG